MTKRLLLFIFLAQALLGCNIQRNMLYYPGKDLPSKEYLAASRLSFWPSGPEGYRGFAGTEPAHKGKATIVLFHGNAGTAYDRDFYVHALVPLGFRVILAEYPGYGARKGELSEQSFTRDARETLRQAFEQYGSPLFVVGESLGCGVAASAVKDSPVAIDGLILITPWDTLRSVAKDHFPWLPVGLFLRDKYDTVENLKAFRDRILIIGAERDDVIPVRHAERLFESLGGEKKMWVIGKAGHNDWPEAVDRAWWSRLAAFIEGTRPEMTEAP